MSEKNTNGLSVSFRVDSGYLDHNNRVITAHNVDVSRTSDNITYTKIDLRDFYQQVFGEAIIECNLKQERPDREIHDYYEQVKKSKKVKLFYEVVVQFGDLHDCGFGSENWETAKTMLDEYIREFEKRNPNLKVFNAVMHLDESTPHLHIDFVPVAHKGQRGMPIKNSMSGALREQGFSSSNKMQNEWTAWSESERSVMEQILLKHGLRREDKNVHRPHLSVDDYKKAAHEAEQINKLNAHINELKKKPFEELTTEEAALINNQNDVMRERITELRQEFEEMKKKAGAEFVTVNIYSPDKLQYIADGLARAKIPCVAESNTLYIPDYALKTAQAIASHYKPDEKAPTIREKIKLDIDRLVYRTETLDDLLFRLQERGYEIKYGKYISVKHPNAVRFVRLKNLGDEYLPKNLEQRIAEKDMFTDRVRYEAQTASPIEKRFHITIINITTAVKQFRLDPKKSDKRRYYFFQNDARINYLSEQLATIGEFGLTSRDSIYEKAKELQHTINQKWLHGEKPEEEEAALKRINTLIKAYEEIIEGNYIDNLIKAQQEEKQAAEQNANAHKNAPKKVQKR
ncbi:MAG: plasmid recombination protein [Ruminiclostridium sp.]